MRLVFILLLSSILASNTFSPQYLIWVAPFVAFLSTIEAGLFITSTTLTWLYFRSWEDVLNLAPFTINILVLRNVLLMVNLLVSIILLARHKR